MFTPNKAKPSRLKVFFMILKANLLGIPTPYGFNLKPRAFQVLAQMSQELESLRVKYDYALDKNKEQNSTLEDFRARLRYQHGDLQSYSIAIKELVNTPNVLSKKTLLIVQAHKGDK